MSATHDLNALCGNAEFKKAFQDKLVDKSMTPYLSVIKLTV